MLMSSREGVRFCYQYKLPAVWPGSPGNQTVSSYGTNSNLVLSYRDKYWSKEQLCYFYNNRDSPSLYWGSPFFGLVLRGEERLDEVQRMAWCRERSKDSIISLLSRLVSPPLLHKDPHCCKRNFGQNGVIFFLVFHIYDCTIRSDLVSHFQKCITLGVYHW